MNETLKRVDKKNMQTYKLYYGSVKTEKYITDMSLFTKKCTITPGETN